MITNQDINQTQFAQQEPWLESEWAPPAPEPDPEAVLPSKPWWRRRRYWLGLVFGLVIMVSGLVWWMSGSEMSQSETTPTQLPDTTPRVATSFDKRLEEIETALNQADPADEFLPLPPVNLTIALDRSN